MPSQGNNTGRKLILYRRIERELNDIIRQIAALYRECEVESCDKMLEHLGDIIEWSEYARKYAKAVIAKRGSNK